MTSSFTDLVSTEVHAGRQTASVRDLQHGYGQLAKRLDQLLDETSKGPDKTKVLKILVHIGATAQLIAELLGYLDHPHHHK